MKIRHCLEIPAPLERVWELTLAVEQWPGFIPTISSVVLSQPGPLTAGSLVRVDQPWQPSRMWQVVGVDAPRQFSWQTTSPGLTLTAHHRLHQTERGCRNELELELSGLASGFVWILLGPLLWLALSIENQAFLRRAAGA